MELAIIQDLLRFLSVQVGDAQSNHIGEVHFVQPMVQHLRPGEPLGKAKSRFCYAAMGLLASDLGLLESVAYLWVMDAKWSLELCKWNTQTLTLTCSEVVDLYEASRDERHIIHIMLPGKRKQRTLSAQHERLLENS